jgi:chromosome segregation ATPase
MLDALFGAGKGQPPAAAELQALIETAREERAALGEMLTQVTHRSAKLSQTGKSIEQVDKTATGAIERVESVAGRLANLDDRVKGLEEIDTRMQQFLDTVTSARQDIENLVGSGSELQKHRDEVQQLSQRALETRASLETLNREQQAVEDLRGQLRETQGEIKRSLDEMSSVTGDVDGARALVARLTEDIALLQDASREAHNQGRGAMDTLQEVEKKLARLGALEEQSRSAEERLATLNALAEHVSHKAKALESQKHMVERAVVEANRLNEMVWAMDVQIQKLNDGNAQIANTEQTLGRIERLAHETAGQLESAMKAKEAFGLEIARLEKESTGLANSVRVQIDRWSIEKRELDVVDQRLRVVQAAVARAEGRMETLAAADKSVAQLVQRAETIAKHFETLSAESDDLMQKQSLVESLNERLLQIEELSSGTASQLANLNRSQHELQALRADIVDCRKQHAEATRLRDELASDRTVFEAFSAQVAAFMAKMPEIDSRMGAVVARFDAIEAGAGTAAQVGQLVSELDGQVTRMTARLEFVDRLEKRLSALSGLNADVDERLRDQLTRRAELEGVKVQCETVSVQIMDAEQKLEAVSDSHARLLPLTNDVARLESRVAAVTAQLKGLQRDDVSVRDQERRLNDLVESDRALAGQMNDRLRQMQDMRDELGRAGSLKDELFEELSRVRSEQRESLAYLEASADRIARVETMMAQLEARRAQLASGEQTVSALGNRIDELNLLARQVDAQIEALSGRQELIASVKAEVDSIHQLGARSRIELQEVADQRGDLAALKSAVDRMVALIAETNDKVVLLEMRKKLVDEVESKSTMIVNLLDDVHLSLEALGEQKALVDHVAEKMAGANFVLQEAQNTLRALNQERERAERVEQSIKQLRARTQSREATKRLAS